MCAPDFNKTRIADIADKSQEAPSLDIISCSQSSAVWRERRQGKTSAAHDKSTSYVFGRVVPRGEFPAEIDRRQTACSPSVGTVRKCAGGGDSICISSPSGRTSPLPVAAVPLPPHTEPRGASFFVRWVLEEGLMYGDDFLHIRKYINQRQETLNSAEQFCKRLRRQMANITTGGRDAESRTTPSGPGRIPIAHVLLKTGERHRVGTVRARQYISRNPPPNVWS